MRQRHVLISLIAILFVFIAVGKAHSQPQRVVKKVPVSKPETETMRIFGYPPKYPVEFVGNAWEIYANGVIDDGAAERLKRFLQKNKVPPKSLEHR